MTGMEHATEQATKVVDGILSADPQIAHEMRGDEPDRIARALAEAGLLNPAPLQEAQAEAWDECSQWHAEQGMPVYGAGNEHNPYRTEGDGRDVTHE